MVRKAQFLLGQVAFLSPPEIPAITRSVFIAESGGCWQTSPGGCGWRSVPFLWTASSVGITSVAAVPQPLLKAITASASACVCSGLVLAAQC